jgi:phosphate starvation-inducible membrane PsiE
MTIYLYLKNKKYYVSPILTHTNGMKQIAMFEELELQDIEYTNIHKSMTFHILNNCIVIPPRNSMYMIINKKTLKVVTFEKFNVLKNYKIGEDDLVFEIYYINHAILVYYMKSDQNIDLKKFYHICISCGNIHTDKIETCTGCAQTVCSECNPFNSVLCTNCDTVFDDDIEEHSNNLLEEIDFCQEKNE